MSAAEISLRVPGKREYALVIRTALGGVAVLKDLNVDALDDLRAAADEACDCLLHQGRAVSAVQVRVQDGGDMLKSAWRRSSSAPGTLLAPCRPMYPARCWKR